MKKTVKIVALAMALVLCTLALVSCSSFGSIKSNFEKNGYELVSADKETTGTIKLEEGEITYTIHTFQLKQEEGGSALDNILGGIAQGLSTAIVWEFASDKDLAKAMEENEDIKAVLKDAEESKFVNGNCILMTINPDAVKIFNGESLEK